MLKQYKKVKKKHEISGDLQRDVLQVIGNGERLQAIGLLLPPKKESSRSVGVKRQKSQNRGCLLLGDLAVGGPLGSGGGSDGGRTWTNQEW